MVPSRQARIPRGCCGPETLLSLWCIIWPIWTYSGSHLGQGTSSRRRSAKGPTTSMDLYPRSTWQRSGWGRWKLQHSDTKSLKNHTSGCSYDSYVIETTAMTTCDNLWIKNWSNFEANSLGAGSGEGHSYASETNFRWNSQGEFVGIGELYGKLKRSWPFFLVKSFCWKTSFCLRSHSEDEIDIHFDVEGSCLWSGSFQLYPMFQRGSAGAVVNDIFFFGFMVLGKDSPLGWFGYRYLIMDLWGIEGILKCPKKYVQLIRSTPRQIVQG